MYEIIQPIHSYIAYVTLVILILSVLNAVIGFANNNKFSIEKDFRISLFALILSHTMLLIGLLLFFVSPSGLNAIKEIGIGNLPSEARLLALEHPFINIIALVLITVGWSRHKKFDIAKKKFKNIAIFYGLGLLLIISRIPWRQWI